MARDWSDLFITTASAADRAARGGDAAAGEGPTAERSERRRGLLGRLRENMARTRAALGSEIQATLAQSATDGQAWERLEETLIMADLGAATTAAVVRQLEAEAGARQAGDQAGGAADVAGLAERLIALLAEIARTGSDRIDITAAPAVILMAGVNGAGKTTTLGKLAWHLRNELGQKVVLGAADTFRAAATEQLQGWAQRAGVEIVAGAPGSDPGAVAFETVARARGGGYDVALIDTAGRLHTQDELMGELQKIRRVIASQCEGAPHETLLTVDATTGQNGLRQARLFAEAVAVDGIALTKLDGTAKGGIALAIARELGIAVKLIGTGEALEDLRPFDAEDFARALIA